MKHDHTGQWLWVTIAWGAILVASALLHGCADLAPFPTTPNGAHALFCEREACPAEAMKQGGNVIEWSYDRKARSCTCIIEDERGLQSVYEVPVAGPFGARRVGRVLSRGHVGGPLGLD